MEVSPTTKERKIKTILVRYKKDSGNQRKTSNYSKWSMPFENYVLKWLHIFKITNKIQPLNHFIVLYLALVIMSEYIFFKKKQQRTYSVQFLLPHFHIFQNWLKADTSSFFTVNSDMRRTQSAPKSRILFSFKSILRVSWGAPVKIVVRLLWQMGKRVGISSIFRQIKT